MNRFWILVLAGITLGSARPGFAQDTTTALLAWGQHYRQDQPAGPALSEDPSFQFLSYLQLPGSAGWPAAYFRAPGGQLTYLQPEGDELTVFQHQEGFGYRLELETEYPTGSYEVHFDTATEGHRAITLEVTTVDYPNPPRLANFAEGQAVDAGADFVVSWDPLLGGTTDDWIQLSVEDDDGEQVFQTGELGEEGALDGSATSATIPAGTLNPGQEYWGELVFGRSLDVEDTQYPEVVGMGVSYGATEFTLVTSGVQVAFRPYVQDRSPSDLSAEVSVDSVVAWRFSKKMDGGISVQWSANLQAHQFRYQWNEGQTVLFAVPESPLPDNAVVRWTLNPNGQDPEFRDLFGTALWETSGQFNTGPSGERSTDLADLFFVRAVDYVQEAETPQELGYYFVGLYADLNAHNVVTNGLLTVPGGVEIEPDLDDGGTAYQLEAHYGVEADLDRWFPDGDYHLVLETAHDGLKQFTLPIQRQAAPSAPRIVDLFEAQAVDPAADFTLNWTGFSGATTEDLVLLEIRDAGDEDVLVPGEDDPVMVEGTATSVVLSAGTLSPGRTYMGIIRFLRVLKNDDVSYPGVTVVSGVLASTRFPITASGEPLAPRLEIVGQDENWIHLRITGEPRQPYTIEIAYDLPPVGIWMPWYSEASDSGIFDFIEYEVPHTLRRLYRVRDGELIP